MSLNQPLAVAMIDAGDEVIRIYNAVRKMKILTRVGSPGISMPGGSSESTPAGIGMHRLPK